MGLREGKNREIKNVLGALGLDVNRLIRISFGPFQLGDIREGEVFEIKSRILREQLGERMIEESGANFDAPLSEHLPAPKAEAKPKPAAKPAQREWISSSEKTERARARMDTKPGRPSRDGPSRDGPSRDGKTFGRDRDRAPDRDRPDRDRGERKPFGASRPEKVRRRTQRRAGCEASQAQLCSAQSRRQCMDGARRASRGGCQEGRG